MPRITTDDDKAKILALIPPAPESITLEQLRAAAGLENRSLGQRLRGLIKDGLVARHITLENNRPVKSAERYSRTTAGAAR